MKKYRIDKNINIGNVIFVVEGGNTNTGGTELRLLKRYLLIYWDMRFKNSGAVAKNLSDMDVIHSFVYLH